MPKQNKHIATRSLNVVKSNKIIASVLVLIFVAVGIIVVLRAFAGSATVFRTNPDYWRPRIAQCESGTNYSNKKNPKYRGAYQYSFSTWGNYKGYADPADAPPEVQDERFYLSFAKSGTSAWSSSFGCWSRGAVVPASVDDQVNAVASPPAPPAKPFGVTSGSYNVVVNGRATLNDAPLPGLTLATCSADRTVTTDGEGRFAFGIPVGNTFCLRPTAGVPAGATLSRTSNVVEQANQPTFENQIAGVNCYRQFWCFLSPSYSWDRSRDAGYNFFYTLPTP